MRKKPTWILPNGVQELVPPEASYLEDIRRSILDTMAAWGYELVQPPGVEYLETLLEGLGPDLDLQTFKLTDQLTGRLLGIPADITPQIARIDSRNVSPYKIQRYCYVGSILHTLPDRFAGSRNPMQIGAELYGHEGKESDAEIIALLVQVLGIADISPLSLELGDMGLFRTICDEADLELEVQGEVLRFLLKKNENDLEMFLEECSVKPAVRELFMSLMELNGPVDILEKALKIFKKRSRELRTRLESLKQLVRLLNERLPNLDVSIDLAELKGFRYHSSTTFSIYTPMAGRAIAWGGRYQIKTDSSYRSATGFSADLRTLLEFGEAKWRLKERVLAPRGNGKDLREEIARLRTLGYAVVQSLSRDANIHQDVKFDKHLVKRNGKWHLE